MFVIALMCIDPAVSAIVTVATLTPISRTCNTRSVRTARPTARMIVYVSCSYVVLYFVYSYFCQFCYYRCRSSMITRIVVIASIAPIDIIPRREFTA